MVRQRQRIMVGDGKSDFGACAAVEAVEHALAPQFAKTEPRMVHRDAVTEGAVLPVLAKTAHIVKQSHDFGLGPVVGRHAERIRQAGHVVPHLEGMLDLDVQGQVLGPISGEKTVRVAFEPMAKGIEKNLHAGAPIDPAKAGPPRPETAGADSGGR